MNSVDPDYRQMALYDLTTMLSRPLFAMSESEEAIAVTWVLKCFTPSEKNTEVVNNAVRLIGLLAQKLSVRKQDELLRGLAKVICEATLREGQTQQDSTLLKENAAMALKLTVQSFTAKGSPAGDSLIRATAKLASDVVTTLVTALRNSTLETRVRSEVFDVVADFADAYGPGICAAHEHGVAVCLQEIGSDSTSRKRATNCIAKLAPHVSHAIFQSITGDLAKGLQSDARKIRKYVEVCNAVCRTSSARFDSDSVKAVVQQLLCELQRLKNLSEDERDSREADETREQILSALESFVGNCRALMLPFIDTVFPAVEEHQAWDPNYCYDNEEEETFAEEDEDAYDYDDGDTSWKVRVAAARCMTRIAGAFQDCPAYTQIAGAVLRASVERLNERVEQVRIAVIDTLVKIIEVARGSPRLDDDGVTSTRSTVERPEILSMILESKQSILEKLIGSAKHKDLKVKQRAVAAMQALFSLCSTELTSHLAAALAAAVSALQADTKRQLPALMSDCLVLIKLLVAAAHRMPASSTRDQVVDIICSSVVPQVLIVLEDRFFKTVLAALRVVQQLGVMDLARSDIVVSLFRGVHRCVTSPSSDLETKRAGVDIVATMIFRSFALLRPACNDEVSRALEYFLQLLASETTRTISCKAIEVVGRVPGLPAQIMALMVQELNGLLRKSDRNVREAALAALTSVVSTYPNVVTEKNLKSLVEDLAARHGEASSFIDEKDFFMASHALLLTDALVRTGDGAGQLIVSRVVPSVVKLMASPLIQGGALENSVAVLATCATVCPSQADTMLECLVKESSSGSIASLSFGIGAVIGAVSRKVGPAEGEKRIQTIAALPNKSLALASIGCVGRFVRLPEKYVRLLLNVDSAAILEESHAAAAALGLGRAASSVHNSELLATIVAAAQDQSLPQSSLQHLIRAIKEAILLAHGTKDSPSSLASDSSSVMTLDVLLSAIGRNDEFLSDIITESVGRLVSLNIRVLLPHLLNALHRSPSIAALAVAAMKYVVPQTVDEESQLSAALPSFLCQFSRTSPPMIRKSCIQLLHMTTLYRPRLLQLTTALLSNLFDELLCDKSLVNEVDLGPFKHRVDNGLELRKAALECCLTLVDSTTKGASNFLTTMNSLEELWQKLASQLATACGLPDEPEMEISNAARNALVKVARLRPDVILKVAPTVGQKLNALLNQKPKEGHEAEKFQDSIRIGIMCLVNIVDACPGARADPIFAEALANAEKNSKYSEAIAFNNSR